MTSKNGSKELLSLLQYMKKTDINNPEVKVKDERLLELDKIVTEVRESEEWEAVRMDILDVGINKGMEIGHEKGIQAVIETCMELNVSKENTLEKLVIKFDLTKDKAQDYMEKYWR